MKKTTFGFALIIFSFLSVNSVLAGSVHSIDLEIKKHPNKLFRTISTTIAEYTERYPVEINNVDQSSAIEIDPFTTVIHQKDNRNRNQQEAAWDGKLSAPQKMLNVRANQVVFNDKNKDWKIRSLSVFGMGGLDEIFVFDRSATVSLKTFSQNQVWVAPINENNVIDVQLVQKCKMINNFCNFETEILDKVILFEKINKKGVTETLSKISPTSFYRSRGARSTKKTNTNLKRSSASYYRYRGIRKTRKPRKNISSRPKNRRVFSR